jgi:hypothetical protein
VAVTRIDDVQAAMSVYGERLNGYDRVDAHASFGNRPELLEPP